MLVLVLLLLCVISLTLLWSCICRGLTLNLLQAICEILLTIQQDSTLFYFFKRYCLPSVVGLSYRHYFSKRFPETEGMCRADVWWNAALIRRWFFRFYFIFLTLLEQRSFAVLEKNSDTAYSGRSQESPCSIFHENVDELWWNEFDNVDISEGNHRIVIMFLPVVDHTALSPDPLRFSDLFYSKSFFSSSSDHLIPCLQSKSIELVTRVTRTVRIHTFTNYARTWE